MSLVRPEDLDREGAALVQAAEALVVVDDASYVEAGERRRTVKAYLGRVDEVMAPIVEAAHHAHKVAVQQRDGLKRPAMAADDIYKTRRLAYEDERERQRRAAEAAHQREVERLAAEARAAVATETARLRAEEETRRLEVAAALEAAGDREAAERVIEEPIVVAVAPAPVVFVPPPTVAPAAKVGGITARMEWAFEITDPAAVPREYLMVDESRIRRVVQALKEQTRIPGVRVYPRRNESVRAR